MKINQAKFKPLDTKNWNSWKVERGFIDEENCMERPISTQGGEAEVE